MKRNFKILIMTIAMSVASSTIVAQPDFFFQFGGDNYQRITSMERDAENNIILSGTFREEMDADPGPGVEMLIAEGYDEIFVIKLNENGEFIWSISIGAGQQDIARDMEVDEEGNIHILGTFQGTVDFDPGPGSHIMQTPGNPLNSSNMFVAKYSPEGEFVHALHLRTTVDNTTSTARSLTIDSEGNRIIVGSTSGPIDMDPFEGVYILEPEADFSDIVIVKLSPTGSLLWAHIFNGEIGDAGEKVTVDENGNIYCTGSFRSIIDFDPGAGSFVLGTQGNDTHNDIFILSLDENGNFRWAKGIGWDGSQIGREIKYSPDGYIYVGGIFSNTVNFNPGGNMDMTLTSLGWDDCFFMKISVEGEVQWAKSWGSPSYEYVNDISIGTENQITVTGRFRETIDFDSEVPGLSLTSAGETDIFLLTWNENGNLVSAFSFGGEGSDYGYCAQLEVNGKYLIAGSFLTEIEFQPGNPGSFLTTMDEEDAFLVYFNPSVPLKTEEADKTPFHLYPNPATGEVLVEIPDTEIKIIYLVDVQGRIIKSGIPNRNNRLNLEGVKAGFYNLVVETPFGNMTRKLIIE